MNICEIPRKSVWLLLFALVAFLGGPAGGPSAALAQQNAAGFPEFENEFFNDFSASLSNAQKIEISRNLRLASESSQIHSMIVVIKKVADYPGLPQEIHSMALQLARERKVGSQKTHQGLLALFALEDRKFTVAHTSNLPTKLAESIRDAFNGRVRAKLKEGQTGQALVFASEDFASLVPKASKTGVVGAPATRAPLASQPEKVRSESAKDSGFGAGTWIMIIFGGYVLLSLLGRLFSGGGGIGGGGAGWGGFLGALLGGGLLGYWLGNSSSNASDSHSSGGGLGGSGSDGGSDSSDSGGFDSFGGGDFGGGSDGGGSGGDW
jgi:hypothetical protein